MKNIFIIISFFYFSQLFSQNENNIELRKSYKIIENANSLILSFPDKKTISIDTLELKIDSSQLDFVKSFDLLDNKKLVKRYKFHAFGYNKKRTLGQITGPIVIYMDKDFPKAIKTKFIGFIEAIPKIKNLNFSFTKDIDNANYFIDILDEDVSFYTKEQKENLTTEEYNNETFSEMSYELYANRNSKYNSCYFRINKSYINDTLLLTKLKKGFLRSLGNFFESSYAPETSLLHKKPIMENEYMSDYDVLMLKYHYQHLYDFKVNLKTFDAFVKMRQTKN